MEDCEWMYTGHATQCQVTNEWIDKTNAFLNRVFGKAAKSSSLVFCPYNKCANRKRVNKDNMGKHLLKMDLHRTIPGGSTTVKPIV